MSISSFCIEQREREQEALKKFLAISLVGSAVLHVALAFSINWLDQEPEFVDEPIEIIIVEEPEPPPVQPKEEKLEETPIPEPPPVKPPKIQELIETKIVEAPQPLPPTPVTPPKPVMASSSIAPSSADSRRFSDNFSGSDSSSVSPAGSEEQGSPTSPGEVVAAGSAPAKPEIREGGGGLRCVRRCNPKYPSSLNGEEGTTIVRIVVDQNGNVVETEVAGNSGNSQVDQEALTAARKMRFSAPEGGGIALLYVITAIGIVLIGISGYAFQTLRNVEKILPDHDMTNNG